MDLKILEIASDTSNLRKIKNFTHSFKLKNSFCGDEIKIELIMKNKKIKDFGYQGKSCVYCQATASMLSKKVIDFNKDQINELCDFSKNFFSNENLTFKKKWKFLHNLLNKKNLARKECILLPFNVLKKIVSD